MGCGKENATANLEYVFGFHCCIKQGIAFCGNKVVLFLAGEMCVLHDIEQNQQKFLHFPELVSPTVMTQGPKSIVAVADKHPVSRVILYDTERGSRKILPEPDVKVEEYLCLCFSPNFKYLAAQSGPPNCALVLWTWEKRVLKMVYLPQSMRPGAEILQILFHPTDNDQIVAVGKQYFRLYRLEEEEGLKVQVFGKHEPFGDYLCIEWLSQGWLAVGTSEGTILFFDGLEEVSNIAISEQPLSDSEQESEKSGGDFEEIKTTSLHVTCLVSTNGGLICTNGGSTAIEFMRTEDNKHYKFKQSIHLPKIKATLLKEGIGEITSNEHSIAYMKLSPNGDLLIACTDNGQLFSLSLIGEDVTKGAKQYFSSVTEPVHEHAITGMDVAVKMPLVVTCSERNVFTWDYLKKVLVMGKCFDNLILSVAIHPLGLYLVISFEECTRVFMILTDDLLQMAEIATKNCTEATFAHGGHLLAVTNGPNIELYNFITLEMIAQLNGQQGSVTGIVWNQCDTAVFSCNNEGSIFGWSIITKEKNIEILVNGTAVSAISVDQEGKYIYAVGDDNTIKEFLGSESSKVVQTGVEITALSMSYSGRLLFGGTKKGCLRTFQFPLSTSAAFTDTPAHSGKINKLKIVLGEHHLMTAGVDGMLCIWKITGMEKHLEAMKFSEAILIDQDDLKNYLETFDSLKQELTQIQAEAEYKLESKDEFYKQHIHTISSNLQKKISDLNAVITHISKENELTCLEHEGNEAGLREKGLSECYKLEESTSAKLEKEYIRYDKLRRESTMLQESLNDTLNELQEKSENDLNQLLSSYEEKLSEKENIIREQKKLVKQKEEDHQEFCRELQVKAEARIKHVKANHARDIHLLKEEVDKMKDAHEIAQQKMHYQQKMIDDLKQQVILRHDENSQLKTVINNIEQDIDHIQKTIDKKSSIIQNLQKKILHLHEKKQNLEKHQLVLNSALNNQITNVQQDDGISETEVKIIQKLRFELGCSHVNQKQLEMEMEALGNRVKSIQKELAKEKLKVTNAENMLERYKSDLLLCAAVIEEPQKLKKSVRKLLESHLQDKKHEEVDLVPKDQSQFPREHLEKTLHLLRKQMLKENKLHHRRCARMGQEKDQNLRSINRLHEDLEMAQQRSHDMESALGMTCQEIIADGITARQKLGEAYTAVSLKEEKMKEELQKQENLILSQEKEISRLHALVYGYRIVK